MGEGRRCSLPAVVALSVIGYLEIFISPGAVGCGLWSNRSGDFFSTLGYVTGIEDCMVPKLGTRSRLVNGREFEELDGDVNALQPLKRNYVYNLNCVY